MSLQSIVTCNLKPAYLECNVEPFTEEFPNNISHLTEGLRKTVNAVCQAVLSQKALSFFVMKDEKNPTGIFIKNSSEIHIGYEWANKLKSTKKIDFLCSQKKEYLSIIKEIPDDHSQIVHWIKQLPPERLKNFRELSNKFHYDLDIEEIEALVSLKGVEIIIAKVREAKLLDYGLISYTMLGASVIVGLGLVNGFHNLFVSPFITWIYDQWNNTHSETNLLYYYLDPRIPTVLGITVTIFTIFEKDRSHQLQADKFCTALSNNLHPYFKKQLAHSILVKDAPLNFREYIQSFFLDKCGESFKHLLGLSFERSIRDRLQTFSKTKQFTR